MSSDTAILTGVRALWSQGHLQDLNIQVEDRSFRVHKLIMAVVSDYFNAMLTGGMAESRLDTVPLGVVTASAMESLISFIYKNHMALNGDNVAGILDAAVYLQMHSAIEACMEFMLDNLDAKTCYTVLSVFQKYSLVDGIKKVRSYIQANIKMIAAECDTLAIPYDECCFIVDHWHNTEMDLFNFIMKWVKADCENRKEYANVIMVNVRFCLMTPKELGVVRMTKLYEECEGDWLSLIDAAVRYHESPVNQKVLNDSVQNTVRSDPAVTVFSVTDRPPCCYILGEEKLWKKKYNICPPGTCHLPVCSIQVNNFLIVVTSASWDNKMFIFDPRTLLWSHLTELWESRDDCAIVYLKGELYILGGCILTRKCESINQYNFQTNTWSSVLKLPEKRLMFAACTRNEHIYISGGYNDKLDGELADFDCLNVESGHWESKAPMLVAGTEHSMTVMKLHGEEVICVIFRDLRVDYYNECSNQWSRFTFSCNHSLPGNTLEGLVILNENTVYYIDGNSCGGARCNDWSCFELKFPEEGNDVIVNKIEHFSSHDYDLAPCGGVLSLPPLHTLLK